VSIGSFRDIRDREERSIRFRRVANDVTATAARRTYASVNDGGGTAPKEVQAAFCQWLCRAFFSRYEGVTDNLITNLSDWEFENTLQGVYPASPYRCGH
jgi:hypothetical protein